MMRAFTPGAHKVLKNSNLLQRQKPDVTGLAKKVGP
jgi:hypothetical protein